MKTGLDISVVILSWNDEAYLEGCLQSLANQAKSRSMEIIVVDNGSTDGTPDRVSVKFPHAKWIRNKENLGFAGGNNVAVRASTGKYVFLLNSDIKVLDGCMDALADYMDGHEDIGIIGPKILNRDLTLQGSCRHFPTLWNNFCVMSGLASVWRQSKMFSGEVMLYFKGDRQIDVDVLAGCFWVVRRTAMDEFGLLDEGFFMYAEDLDWCKRSWEAGWRVVFYPGAEAIHYGGGSSGKKDPVWAAVMQQRSILRYWRKHHGALGVLGLSCLIFANKCARCVLAFFNYLARPSKRPDSLLRMRVAGGLLRALFSRGGAERA